MNYEILSLKTTKKLAEYKKIKVEYQKLKLQYESLLRKLKKMAEEKDYS